MDTKIINTIKILDQQLNHIVDENINQRIMLEVEKFKNMLKEINNLIETDWVYMENREVYYNNRLIALHPDLSNFDCGCCNVGEEFKADSLKLSFGGFKGTLMSLQEIKRICVNGYNLFMDQKSNILTGKSPMKYLTFETGKGLKWVNITNLDEGWFDCSHGYTSYNLPIYRLSREGQKELDIYKIIDLWTKLALIPQNLSKEAKNQYIKLIKIYTTYQEYTEKGKSFFKKFMSELETGAFKGKIDGMGFDKTQQIEEAKKNQLFKVSGEFFQGLCNKLLSCEEYRADIEKYDEKLLTDPNRGHWDLWDEEDGEGLVTLQLGKELMARNPLADIMDGGVIGIDFGTKSTVVVYQKNSDYTLPMRVGMGRYSKKIEAKHYENPTVMEFINIDSFLEKYHSHLGRPDTKWEDLTVSHTALNSLLASSSENFYSYFSELKQWAGDKHRQIRLRDKQGKDIVLPAYSEMGINDLDPIELYAYFIGLHINNMHNGIYLDYILSFPVTYEKSVREKIVQSFDRGIKKSLPSVVLKNEYVMSRFRVVAGASEPAAYAICALQEYRFEPTSDEKVFYGVFDFGGGTTDFDFGLWREAKQNEKRYDYVIEHFGANGDQFLGGENLLELLAFEIFKANQDKLRENGITFILPPECQPFAGSEILISESQEAKLNTKQLMEKVRPLWERHEGYEKVFDNGVIKVNLFNKDGQPKLNFELSIYQEGLETILYERIDKGVRNFIDSLRLAFDFPQTFGVDKIKIFMAGNSSKSQFVKDIFNKYIETLTQEINELNHTEKELFEIFPPLGTEEAYLKQSERGVEVDKDAITKPTGKTGVAFGLLRSRKGGRIKVEDRNINGYEIKFKYYVGLNKKGKLEVKLDREIEYGKWVELVDASEEDFEFYFTNLPEASSKQLDINKVNRKKCRISMVSDEAFVYLRAVEPAVIEYVVATEEGIKKNEYVNDIVKIDLN